MHLEKEILKGKHFKKGELKKEAAEELGETRKGKKELKHIVAGKMKKGMSGVEGFRALQGGIDKYHKNLKKFLR